jgi:FlgN protein
VQALLAQLQAEEEVVRAGRQVVMRLYTTLRKGDLPAVEALWPEHEQLAADLKGRAAIRELAAVALAAALDLPPTATLTELAAPLSPPLAEAVLGARQRLRALTRQVEQFQSANANLISHLRCYFRGVLNGLAADPPSPRYGPTGTAVSGPVAAALTASG